MQNLRWVHRWATVVVVIFTFYLGLTGVLMQVIDLKTIYSQAPATDPDLQAIRESFDGPGNYQVRETRDYLAAPLPDASRFPALIGQTMAAARKQLGDAPLTYVELRMIGDQPVGQVGLGKGHARFDPATGALIERTEQDHAEQAPQNSPRNVFKHLHRMTTFGDWALMINIVASIALAVLIVTGVWIYFKLLGGRRKINRAGVFWSGGGTWRSLHRSVSIVMAAFLVVVTLSGAWLAVESAGLAIFMRTHRPAPAAGGPGGNRPAPQPSAITPVVDAAIPQMLSRTLDAAKADAPGDPIKVIRLRTYAGYRQGVVVTGGDNSRQLVYDTANGRSLSTTEPGYPAVPFPFGWQAHQVAKSIHRGDWFGMTGRWADLLAGFAMVYLSLSGAIMYYQMWRKRADTGRKRLTWK
jgi:uncharacterized iron-regulated membrane protein